MTTFDERDKGFENKFAHDAEISFKINARRNKLLGIWAAEKLGKAGTNAEEYAKDVVMADLGSNGDNDVIDKLLKDFGRAGISIPVKDIETQMTSLLPIAQKQIMGSDN